MAGKKHDSKIILGTAFLLALSACRFGNYSEAPKAPDSSHIDGFKSVEFFTTQAKQLETVVVYSDGQQSVNSNVPLASIPSSVLDTISDPVYFAVPADPNESAMFVGKNQKNYINTTVNAAGNIEDESASSIVTLWKNPACQTQVQIAQMGAFDRSQPGTTVVDGTTHPLAGKLSLELTYIRVVAGDCAADLQEMAQCYQDSSRCSTDEWRAATNFFDLYVRQSGVLKIEDAIRIKGLAYIVHFE